MMADFWVGVATGFLLPAAVTLVNHFTARVRARESFELAARERRRDALASLFSDAYAIALMDQRHRADNCEPSQEFTERKLNMLARLRLEAGEDIAWQWAAYSGATGVCEGDQPDQQRAKFEEVCRSLLDRIHSTGKEKKPRQGRGWV